MRGLCLWMVVVDAIRLIVGLGNPGDKYAMTRHNAGFWLADVLAQDFQLQFQASKQFFGEVARGRVQGETIYLLKPTTFMNLSGQAVQAMCHYYKIPLSQVLVLHDELDLLPGQVKLKQGGGHAGHNGLRDIQAKAGGPGFWRLRLGIGHPRQLNLSQPVVDFVLHRPSVTEQDQIEEAIERSRAAIPALIAGDLDRANRLLAPPRAAKNPPRAAKTPAKRNHEPTTRSNEATTRSNEVTTRSNEVTARNNAGTPRE